MKRRIDIAGQFSRHPAGRFESDGPNSGERFREQVLVPILENEDRAEIILDGTRGYGSSFLEEAFGGLVRKGYTVSRIKNTFELVAHDDPSLVDEIISYIDEAAVT